MRTSRLPLAASLTAASAAVLLLAACGGGSQAAAPAAATPASVTSSADPASTPAAAPAPGSSSAPVSSPPTTTTLTLADGGDVLGTKLKSSSSSSATTAVEGGPARGPHQSEPGRSVKDIQVIVQAHRDDARACYDAAQVQHPDATMKGNLDVKWTIDPTGKVTAIAVDDGHSDIHDPGVAKCVMDVIRNLSFSVSAKGFETYAHYPFNFNPKNVRGSAPPPSQP